MKIKIINAWGMGVSLHRKDGDIVEVLWDEALGNYRDEMGYWYCIKWKDEFFEVLEEESTEWSGEGLPPVGTVCECITEKEVYLPCKVIAHGKDNSGYVIVHFFPNDFNIKVDWTRTGCRPLKSQEEIEKERVVKEMSDSISLAMDYIDSTEGIANHLYNLGYRKTT